MYTWAVRPGGGSVQGAGPKGHLWEELKILQHGVGMLFAIGQAGEDEKSGVTHGYYVLRSNRLGELHPGAWGRQSWRRASILAGLAASVNK